MHNTPWVISINNAFHHSPAKSHRYDQAAGSFTWHLAQAWTNTDIRWPEPRRNFNGNVGAKWCDIVHVLPLKTIKTLRRPQYSDSGIVLQVIYYTRCSFRTDGLFMLNITHQNNPSSPKRLNISSPFDSLRITHRYIREFDLSSNLHSTCCLTKHLRHLTGTGI